MKRKKIFMPLALLLMVMCVFTVVSCGEDDNEPSGYSAPKEFVGNWADFYSNGITGHIIYKLKSNGTYTAYENFDLDSSVYDDYWNGKWTYNEEKKILHLDWGGMNGNEHDEDEDDYFYVVSVTNEAMEVVRVPKDFDGDMSYWNVKTLKKIPDSKMPTKYIP